jgi:hypothetical protein
MYHVFSLLKEQEEKIDDVFLFTVIPLKKAPNNLFYFIFFYSV